ncbi:PREDICTED: GSK-3-binding protein-like [Dufourea novaeangliae]|uniref:GSK-3-binding protein-like n=1 Tax=Dufourea novaeangliae TaxID=178035 RepID=UPI0007672B01|nr:PREDICTED: GSK-3-binding protein-like [Dufourea novaeangliae]
MPSAEETTYLIEVMPDTTQDFLSRDVDLLVSRIKENLRLSSLKAKSSISHKNRASPYQVPSRSWGDPSSCEICGTRNTGSHDHRHHISHYHHHHKRQNNREDDDPYELFRELLREGSLIKEAVKRLQETSEEEDNNEHSTVYRRKPYFYDSEDEQLPPVYEPLEL